MEIRMLFVRSDARRLRAGALATLLLGCLATSPAFANPPFQNTSFELVGPAGTPTEHDPPVPGGAGQSAAANWGVFQNNTPFLTRTDLVPSTLPGGGARMLWVSTSAGSNGINQITGPFGTGPAKATTSAWVYVVSGTVLMGAGNGGQTGVDALTTTTGQWEFLQAPAGQSPVNQIIFYALGGPAEFYVDNVDFSPVQDYGFPANAEYSNRYDEREMPGGGGHFQRDPGQTLETTLMDLPGDDQPRDGRDFYPGIEFGIEPDAQVDALAHGGDAGFERLLNNELDLLFSLRGDLPAEGGIVAFHETPAGVIDAGILYQDLHADQFMSSPEIDDVDGLDLWGTTDDPLNHADANFYSLEDDPGSVSVWTYVSGTPEIYLTTSQIASVATSLGWGGGVGDVDLDALMVHDVAEAGVWDRGDEILFSIEGGIMGFHGGEIIHWRFGDPATFLDHGGHAWDIAHQFQTPYFFTTYDIDAIEVPEPRGGLMLLVGSAAAGMGIRQASRGRRRQA